MDIILKRCTRPIFILIAVALSASNVHATAQYPDILIYKGKAYSLFSNPLESFFNEDNLKPADLFKRESTANWRGYVATWEIVDNYLYLVKLTKGCNNKEIPLEEIFLDRKRPIKAEWYDGTLRIPQGELLMYVHMGYGSVYEREVRLRFEKGKLVQEYVKKNTISKLPSADRR